jgi:hypothetical protein
MGMALSYWSYPAWDCPFLAWGGPKAAPALAPAAGRERDEVHSSAENFAAETRSALRVRGHGRNVRRAFSGKVETGFPQKMPQTKS